MSETANSEFSKCSIPSHWSILATTRGCDTRTGCLEMPNLVLSSRLVHHRIPQAKYEVGPYRRNLCRNGQDEQDPDSVLMHGTVIRTLFMVPDRQVYDGKYTPHAHLPPHFLASPFSAFTPPTTRPTCTDGIPRALAMPSSGRAPTTEAWDES